MPLRCWPSVGNVVIAPPIPVVDIVEKHLKLGIEFDEMHRLLRRALALVLMRTF